MSKSLSGKVALVTGASRSIRAAVVFLASPAVVSITGTTPAATGGVTA